LSRFASGARTSSFSALMDAVRRFPFLKDEIFHGFYYGKSPVTSDESVEEPFAASQYLVCEPLAPPRVIGLHRAGSIA
jgi:hypothetical protein